MKDYLEQNVAEFHHTYGLPVRPAPILLPEEEHEMRMSLIEEELEELKDARDQGDTIEIFDALCDLLYVVMGYGVQAGYPMTDGIVEVHASNMSKLGEDGKPIYREDGKVLKGPGFFPPDLGYIIAEVTNE